MPELAAIYFSGIMFGLTTTFLFVLYTRRRRKGQAYLTLQANLKKVGLFWSDAQDRLVPWTTDAAEVEDRQSGRSMTVAGLLLSALSWPGAFFYLLIIYSVLVIARSRTEKRIFSSPLTKNSSLSPAEIESLVRDIMPKSAVASAPSVT